jgi:hypothetical protein
MKDSANDANVYFNVPAGTPTCANSPSLSNSKFACAGTVVGGSCIGMCDFGYSLSAAGKPVATCLATGLYSTIDGTCEPTGDWR